MQDPSLELINEIRVFYNTLVNIGEELHRDCGITLGGRAVLEFLDRNGDTTVPRIADARRVSRQRIQSLANELKKLGLIKTIDNPRSKRSPLLHLTPDGKKLMKSMAGRESALLKNIASSDKTITTLVQQLRQVREQIENDGIKGGK